MSARGPNRSEGRGETAGGADRTSFDHVERLLAMAEELQQTRERLQRQEMLVRLVELVLILAGVGLAISVWMSDTSLSSAVVASFALFGLVFSALTAGFIELSIMRTLRQRTRRDARALHEIVNLLREAASVLAEFEAWEPFELAEFRIRLARFDIS